jgi:hypothetical protein
MVNCINLFSELVENAKESTKAGSGFGELGRNPFSVKEIVGYKDFSAKDKKKMRTEMKNREKNYKANKATNYKRTLLKYMRECGIPSKCATECKAVD